MVEHPFDRYDTIKTLTEAGISDAHAEAIVKAISLSHDSNFGNFASKNELIEVRSEVIQVRAELMEVKNEIEKLRADLLIKLETSKNEAMRWVTAVVAGAAAASVISMAGLIVFLFEHLGTK